MWYNRRGGGFSEMTPEAKKQWLSDALHLIICQNGRDGTQGRVCELPTVRTSLTVCYLCDVKMTLHILVAI